MRSLFLLVAVAVGALLPLQAGINAALRTHLGHPLRAGLTNFVVGMLVLLTVALVSGNLALPAGALGAAPPWAFLGGVIGASVVLSSLVLVPKLGGALLFAAIVAGQLTSGVLIDHFGLLGLQRHPITFGRLAGVACVIVGMVLINRN